MMITNKQILEANLALPYLLKLNLPIKSSLGIAQLSVEVDKRVKVFSTVRDTLINNYQIKISAGETADTVKFSSESENKETDVIEFNNKIDELVASEAEDISVRVHIPDDITIPPEILKPILPFIELASA